MARTGFNLWFTWSLIESDLKHPEKARGTNLLGDVTFNARTWAGQNTPMAKLGKVASFLRPFLQNNIAETSR